MKCIVTEITGCAPNLPWWRALAMTSEEIKAYNDQFLKYKTKEYEMTDDDIVGRLNQVANPAPGSGLYLEVGTATVAQAYEAFVRKVCADAVAEIKRLRTVCGLAIEGKPFSEIKKEIRDGK